MHDATIRPAASPRTPLGELPYRQRRCYAYLRANGARAAGSMANCLEIGELLDDRDDAEATLEALVDAGWARAVGNAETGVVHGYDIPEAERETTLTVLARLTVERSECVDWWDYENGRPKPSHGGV